MKALKGILEAVIADDGRGVDPVHARPEADLQPHFGLSTMRERAEFVAELSTSRARQARARA